MFLRKQQVHLLNLSVFKLSKKNLLLQSPLFVGTWISSEQLASGANLGALGMYIIISSDVTARVGDRPPFRGDTAGANLRYRRSTEKVTENVRWRPGPEPSAQGRKLSVKSPAPVGPLAGAARRAPGLRAQYEATKSTKKLSTGANGQRRMQLPSLSYHDERCSGDPTLPRPGLGSWKAHNAFTVNLASEKHSVASVTMTAMRWRSCQWSW